MNRHFLPAGLALIVCLPAALRAQGAPPSVPVAAPTAPEPGPTALIGSAFQPPDYPVPYRTPTAAEITAVLERVRAYQEAACPARLINRRTREEITDLSHANPEASFDRGEHNAFPPLSYEAGVTYAGMLEAGAVTGDPKFNEFVARRFQFVADHLAFFRLQYEAAQAGAAPPTPGLPPSPAQMRRYEFRSTIDPQTLDECGAMCAAMIKARRAGIGPDLLTVIHRYMNHVSHGQFRLADGTLARQVPQPQTLWLDDMYMSIPALAQMGKLTGDASYFDDAVRQVRQFSARMFDRSKGLYMHGWAADTDDHPEFFWARANGWAAMAMVELLSDLPEDHPGRAEVLEQLRAHLRGLAACQSGTGLWHQLLDRNDSYLETSATAMFVFSMARAVNRGWVSGVTYGPVAQLGWNALTTKVNAQGQVEDTCVGTGMGADPAFYYHRPRSPFAQHGYGPVLMAGAEMIRLLQNEHYMITRGTIQYVPRAAKP